MPALASTAPPDDAIPRYDHIIVIVEENKGYATELERGHVRHSRRRRVVLHAARDAERVQGIERARLRLDAARLPEGPSADRLAGHRLARNRSPKAPPGCGKTDAELVRRGDGVLGGLVERIRRAPFWNDPRSNAAIVVTWDEDGKADRVPGAPQACCSFDAHNPGGGHIPTIVITDHGPRGIADATPYDHYSLLRTIEDAFRLDGHLRHAGDAVHPMTPLFAVR